MAKKILVVEDDQINLKIVNARLKQEGFDIVMAQNGEVALDKVVRENPDLIILDVEMPRMNGYTFMLELNKLDQHKGTPVIVLTAHERMQAIFTLKGVRGYFVKPLDFDKLLAKINECLQEGKS